MRNVWGPYCRAELEEGYVVVVYPTAQGLIRDGGRIRPMTEEELEASEVVYRPALDNAFKLNTGE